MASEAWQMAATIYKQTLNSNVPRKIKSNKTIVQLKSFYTFSIKDSVGFDINRTDDVNWLITLQIKELFFL